MRIFPKSLTLSRAAGLTALLALAACGGPEPGTVKDEALEASPPRQAASFPAADEDYFYEMDQFGEGARQLTRREIIGRNNWIVWTGGNDRFWDYMANNTFGALDLLKTLSSHPAIEDRTDGFAFSRDNRWHYLGLVNEPCFDKYQPPPDCDPAEDEWGCGNPDYFGLWLDVRDPSCAPDPFENESKYPGVKIGARGDGTLPVGSFYGEPTGIVGLRLFPNPDFDEAARLAWDPNRFYTDQKYYNRYDLVRPYRVGMSCGFCHVGPNPINPPPDPENPEWEHLSSLVGAQYFWIDRIFIWNVEEKNFVYQLFHTSYPGALDTSLVSTDNINNPRTMNAVYHTLARQVLASKAGYEALAEGGSGDNKQPGDYMGDYEGPCKLDGTLPIHEPGKEPYDFDLSGLTQFAKPDHSGSWTPRVLKDGADSVGVLGALNRVYLNIGLFSEEWLLHFKALVGGKRITPIEISVARENSSYWNATEEQTPCLALFFLNSDWPHKLADYPGGTVYKKYGGYGGSPAYGEEGGYGAGAGYGAEQGYEEGGGYSQQSGYSEGEAYSQAPPYGSGAGAGYEPGAGGDPPGSSYIDESKLPAGRRAFADRCARCHSSKLPEGWARHFPEGCVGPGYLDCWNNYWEWTKTAEFSRQMVEIVEQPDFLDDNYLSNELRVPVTLLETNACSPLATNAIRNDIWDNFSSESYKTLPSVGTIQSFHPVTGEPMEFEAPAGGRGYTRPASLVSLWSTAPYLVSNSLGGPYQCFRPSGSVPDRVDSFECSIEKLLWPEKRLQDHEYVAYLRDHDPKGPGGWWQYPGLHGIDGYMARTTTTSYLTVPTGYLHSRLLRMLLPDPLRLGPIPAGTPINLIANLNPLSEDLGWWARISHTWKVARVLRRAIKDLKALPLDASDREARLVWQNIVEPLLEVNKCPDFVVNRGHYFGTDRFDGEEPLSDEEKWALIEYLKTL